MKLLHIADLHIGRRIHECSLVEDQSFILHAILDICDSQKPDLLVIAGDVYDKSTPILDAVNLLDDFLTELAQRKIEVFLVSGNHDSPERLNFGSRLLQQTGVHIAGLYDGTIPKITLTDSYGNFSVFLLPFLRPAMLKPFLKEGEEAPVTYQEAIQWALSNAKVDTTERNVLVAHQFVTAMGEELQVCDSESISIGSMDNVDYTVFDAFDYVALGHLHGAQRVGRDTVRYAGSPLKYSFSEVNHQKSALLVEFVKKGELSIHKLPLVPLRDMRVLRGNLADLLENGTKSDDYTQVILTDPEVALDPISKLRMVYSNVLRLEYDNQRTAINPESKTAATGDIALQTPLALFEEFYFNQNNVPIPLAQKEVLNELLESILQKEDEE